jgi:hypothetical protein
MHLHWYIFSAIYNGKLLQLLNAMHWCIFRQYFKEEVEARELAVSSTAAGHKEEEWRDTLEANRKWNEETGRQR